MAEIETLNLITSIMLIETLPDGGGGSTPHFKIQVHFHQKGKGKGIIGLKNKNKKQYSLGIKGSQLNAFCP